MTRKRRVPGKLITIRFLLWVLVTRLPAVNCCPKQMILLTEHQKVTRSLAPGHNADVTHLTSSHPVGILSSHIITRRQPFMEERISGPPKIESEDGHYCPTSCRRDNKRDLAWAHVD